MEKIYFRDLSCWLKFAVIGAWIISIQWIINMLALIISLIIGVEF